MLDTTSLTVVELLPEGWFRLETRKATFVCEKQIAWLVNQFKIGNSFEAVEVLQALFHEILTGEYDCYRSIASAGNASIAD